MNPVNTMKTRELKNIIPSRETSDGAGVKLRRSLGSVRGLHLDPFLMLDEFFSDDPDDYIAGFPSHPHRGFETVTYMLDGRMQHKDHLGNTGDLGPGGVQWMTAGHGVIHSEMPQQSEGRMRGFQLWVNLPASEKMKPAAYRDIPAGEIPETEFPGGRARVIAGRFNGVAGPINPNPGDLSTDPSYFDIHLDAGAQVGIPVTAGYNAFLYPYDGQVEVGEARKPLANRSLGTLGDGENVIVRAGEADARLLLLAGKPLNEPIVQYGPFVMNTREEIEQAVNDYQSGRLTG